MPVTGHLLSLVRQCWFNFCPEVHPRHIRGLRRGWIPGREYVDLQDQQWSFFRGQLPLLTGAAVGFLLLSHAIRGKGNVRVHTGAIRRCFQVFQSLGIDIRGVSCFFLCFLPLIELPATDSLLPRVRSRIPGSDQRPLCRKPTAFLHCTHPSIHLWLQYFLIISFRSHPFWGWTQIWIFTIVLINFGIARIFRGTFLNPVLTWTFACAVLVISSSHFEKSERVDFPKPQIILS